MDRAKILASLSAVLLIAVLMCGCGQSPHITVGSKNFTEQVLLGEILAQQVERRLHIRVERKLNLGGTLLAHQALTTGGLDLYPEYTGTALTAILKQKPSVKDSAAVLEQVRAEYRNRWKLDWLAPLGFNNTFAMTIAAGVARQDHLQTISDAARARPWKLGAGYEFLKREDGMEGLLKAYGLRLQGTPVSMDLGLLYRALEGKQVDMVAANSTDGVLSVLDVTVLRDDKQYFPPYDCAVVVRQEALAAFPTLKAALDELSGAFPEAVMRKLNYAVDGQHRPVREVAAEFLKAR